MVEFLSLKCTPCREAELVDSPAHNLWSHILFGLFKKKYSHNPYLSGVAAILHKTMGPIMPLQNAYDLAAECMAELQGHIRNGTFRTGPDPREMIMAYYCLCSMVRESGSSDNREHVLMVSVMANSLADKIGDSHTFTPLEQGICIFGKQTLKEYFPVPRKDTVASVKQNAADIVFKITSTNGVSISRDDAGALIDNLCANIPETDVCKGGEKVLAISALSSITAYSIDHNDIDGANAYAECFFAAMKNHVEGQMASFNEYQAGALRTVVGEHRSVVQELMEANRRSAES